MKHRIYDVVENHTYFAQRSIHEAQCTTMALCSQRGLNATIRDGFKNFIRCTCIHIIKPNRTIPAYMGVSLLFKITDPKLHNPRIRIYKIHDYLCGFSLIYIIHIYLHFIAICRPSSVPIHRSPAARTLLKSAVKVIFQSNILKICFLRLF